MAFKSSIVIALFIALSLSNMDFGHAGRYLLQTAQPAVPNLPTFPKPTLPPLPSMPQGNVPTLPSIPTITIPSSVPPLPAVSFPNIPSIPNVIPSIPFLSPPPSSTTP
ncbi:hypothetical protein RJT34_04192 [Clitoria ternatea]|uniref:Uncharacterized protein n=1 Tax=Clitoria ternatea TaxID=43366 RepID=A0AAN9KM51_CLITE